MRFSTVGANTNRCSVVDNYTEPTYTTLMNKSWSVELFDEATKTFYQQLFTQWGLRVESQLAIFFRSRTIDLVVHCAETERQRLAGTVFSHFRLLNALEFKGVHDPLTLTDYNRILLRAWGLGALSGRSKQRQSAFLQQILQDERYQLPSQRTVTIVCVTRPDRILDELHSELRFSPTEEPGIYYSDQSLGQWIIHPSELALVPKNYPLLPLARGEKLARFTELCLQASLTDYLQLIIDVGLMTDPDVIWRKLMEMNDMKTMIREDTWPYIEEYLRTVPEVLEKIPTFQEALAEREQRGEQRGEVSAQQQMLLHVLRHKFGDIPATLINRIKATTDATQLTQWLDQTLDATTMAELDLT